jgi:membrane protein
LVRDVEEPEETSVWWYVRTYVVSLAGVLALGFLLVVSLMISTVLAVEVQRARMGGRSR